MLVFYKQYKDFSLEVDRRLFFISGMLKQKDFIISFYVIKNQSLQLKNEEIFGLTSEQI